MLPSQIWPQWAPASDRPNMATGDGDHLVDGVEVAVGEVEQGRVDELAAVPLQLHVVGVLRAGRRRPGGPWRPATGWLSRL